MTDAVVDASAGVEIALRTPVGRRLGASLAGRDAYVPESFYTESARGAAPHPRARRDHR